jgi:hypothetical protein
MNDEDKGHYGMVNAAVKNEGLKKELDLAVDMHRDACIKSIKAKDLHQAELHSDIATAFEDFWARLTSISDAYMQEADDTNEPASGEAGLND